MASTHVLGQGRGEGVTVHQVSGLEGAKVVGTLGHYPPSGT